MSTRFTTAAIALVALLAALLIMRPQSATPVATPEKPSKRLEPPAPAPSNVVVLPIAADAVRLNAPEGSCRTDLDFLDLVISQYRRHLDGNPVGSNAGISAALRGDNPKGIAFLPAEGKFLDSSGHLVDRWGTPYFFHAISRQRMDIVSAGPDREFWTNDDLTSHPAGR
jgi:hypothetical protein